MQQRKSIIDKNREINENKIQKLVNEDVKDNQDIEYFSEELKKIKEIVNISLMTRRLEIHKEDPMEELMEVYQEVKEIESNLKKCINIANFMIEKHKLLF